MNGQNPFANPSAVADAAPAHGAESNNTFAAGQNTAAPANQNAAGGGAAGFAVATSPQQAGFGTGSQLAVAGQNTGTQMATMGGQNNAAALAAAYTPDEVSLDDDVAMSALDKLPKLANQEVCRLAFVLFDHKNAPKLKMAETFYTEIGTSKIYFSAPKHNPELMKACVARFGEPRRRFGTIILRYDTDKNGQLMPNAGYRLFAYMFDKTKFGEFKTQHGEWGLHQHDLILTCTEANFQKTTLAVARECFFRANPQLVNDVTAQAQALYDQYLNRYMGSPRTDAEIVQILNGVVPQRQQGGGQAQLPSGGANGVNPFAAQNGQQPAGAHPGVGGPQHNDFGDLVAQGTQQ